MSYLNRLDEGVVHTALLEQGGMIYPVWLKRGTVSQLTLGGGGVIRAYRGSWIAQLVVRPTEKPGAILTRVRV